MVMTHNGKVLLGKRLSDHGGGTWCFQGGHLELHESWEDAARREVEEETGLSVGKLHFSTVTNDLFDSGKHYITIFLIAEYIGGEPRVCEPDKNECWEWFPWDALPSPLFLPTQNFVKSGCSPFLSG